MPVERLVGGVKQPDLRLVVAVTETWNVAKLELRRWSSVDAATRESTPDRR